MVTAVACCCIEWNFVLLGPLTLRPGSFDKVASISSGLLTLKQTNLICESKGGSVGAEGKVSLMSHDSFN